MKIIINADDFGLSHDVNLAIVEAFEKRLITNTTIMTNMPGFDEAVELSKKYGFFDKVGIHFNIFEGKPLTQKIKSSALLMEDGDMTSYKFFHNSKPFEKLPPPFTSRDLLLEIREEAAAQIKKYIDSGFTEMHFDSHGHSHTFPVVWAAIRPIVKENKFRTVRKSLNFPRGSFAKIMYKSFFNEVMLHSFMRTTYFTSGTGFIQSKKILSEADGTLEIMVHPIYDPTCGKLRNSGNHPNLQDIAKVAGEIGEIVSFNSIYV